MKAINKFSVTITMPDGSSRSSETSDAGLTAEEALTALQQFVYDTRKRIEARKAGQ